MQKRDVFLAVMVTLLLLVAGSAVYAQDGQGGDDKFVIGRDYVLRSGETLNGSLAVLGGSATLEQGSTLNGDVFVAGGRFSAAGTIRGSVAVFGGSAVLGDSAVVQGDFAAFGGTVERAPEATIRGGMFSGWRLEPGRSSPETPEAPDLAVIPQLPVQSQPFRGLSRLLTWEVSTVASALMLIVLGIVAVLVAPRAIGRIASAAADQPALSFGAGVLTLVVGLLGGLLLLIACGLGTLVWLALVIACLVGWIAVGLWLGQRLLSGMKAREPSSVAEVALGLFLITVLANVPWCIGFLFALSVGCIGLGAVVLTRFGRQPVVGVGSAARPEPRSLPALDAEVMAPLVSTAPSTSSEPAPLLLSEDST